MLGWILHKLGVTPDGTKTGKRETAWILIAICIALTVYSMHLGNEMVGAMNSLLYLLWMAALVMLGMSYGLEWWTKQNPLSKQTDQSSQQ